MKLTIKEYAEANGVSTQAVYAKIKRGTLSTVTLHGVQYIVENDTTDCNELVAENKSLTERLLKAQEEIIKVQGQSMQVMSAYITESKQLQPPATVEEEDEKPKKSKKDKKAKKKKKKKS
jgi:predicted DNA-binding protein YlxM (UPF0122 family)